MICNKVQIVPAVKTIPYSKTPKTVLNEETAVSLNPNMNLNP